MKRQIFWQRWQQLGNETGPGPVRETADVEGRTPRKILAKTASVRSDGMTVPALS